MTKARATRLRFGSLLSTGSTIHKTTRDSTTNMAKDAHIMFQGWLFRIMYASTTRTHPLHALAASLGLADFRRESCTDIPASLHLERGRQRPRPCSM